MSLVTASIRDRNDPVAEGARDAAVPIAMMAARRPRLPMLPGREPFAVCVAVPTGRTSDAAAIEVGGRQDQRRPWRVQDHMRPRQRRLRGEHEARKCQDGEVSVHAVISVTGNGTVIRSMDHLPVYAQMISMGYATAFAQLCPTLCPVSSPLLGLVPLLDDCVNLVCVKAGQPPPSSPRRRLIYTWQATCPL